MLGLPQIQADNPHGLLPFLMKQGWDRHVRNMAPSDLQHHWLLSVCSAMCLCLATTSKAVLVGIEGCGCLRYHQPRRLLLS